MNATTQMEITRYVEQVRAALADLPATVRDELLEDLPEHLAEVLAEGDGTLVDRLGDPTEYAAELRASAALDTPATTPGVGHRVAAAWQSTRSRLARVDHRVGPLLGYRSASEFLRLLRPAWWVLRGYLAALLFAHLVTDGSPGLFPRPGGSVVIGLLVLAGFVTASIWLGRRQAGFTRWPRRTLTAATAIVLIFGAVTVAEVDGRSRSSTPGPVYYQNDPYTQVLDVYVYDGQGRLVEGARLFDESGQPISLGDPYRCEHLDYSRQGVEADPARFDNPQYIYPFCPELAPFTLPGSTPTPAPVRTAPSDLPLTPLTPTPDQQEPAADPSATAADPTVSGSPGTPD
ncbi:hypothetical protein O7623_09600 [Solwaraspora sp. WMMD791]|uniref:DUF1700 domain-containing protein n=1 Tax=Solwaraspora sp. WMMD791 TaxID=3016086 RepID=UPI00249BE62A|nr:hypothetical protein [Solwaraspora sp. WMMD791]WFE29416.1 hypothetical protein O7623_09600 [Solwaraspora sp. WMMD791]